jgi:ribose transport system permease protein
VISSDFRSVSNIITILRQASILLILSVGLTAVLLTGEIDLSVGSTAGLIGCLCAQLLKANVSIPLVFLIGIGLGAIIGCFNGFLVGNVKLPSFVATYATNWVASGLAIMVMNGAVIYNLPNGFTWFGTGYISIIPVVVVIAAVLVLIGYVLLQATTFGRDVYGLGSNAEAARYSAIPVKRTMVLTFVMCGVCAAIGGLLMTARLNAADTAMGNAYGLQTVAAIVVGGTSMLGGEGGIGGTVVGALLLTVIVNIMNLLGISSFAQPVVIGLVIIAMVYFDSYKRSKK